MPEYTVVWKIDIEAGSPLRAAEEALQIMLDNEQATFFEILEGKVKIAEVDLYAETLKVMDKRQTDYLKADGFGCPHCGHENTTYAGSDGSGHDMVETYECDKCKKTWTDIYDLVKVDIHA